VNLSSLHVKQFLTVFYVTAGRAPYVPHPTAKSGPEQSWAATAARSLNAVFWQVTGKIACSGLVVRDRIELSTFRFSADSFHAGQRRH
jgi:hypothetical protein